MTRPARWYGALRGVEESLRSRKGARRAFAVLCLRDWRPARLHRSAK